MNKFARKRVPQLLRQTNDQFETVRRFLLSNGFDYQFLLVSSFELYLTASLHDSNAIETTTFQYHQRRWASESGWRLV